MLTAVSSFWIILSTFVWKREKDDGRGLSFCALTLTTCKTCADLALTSDREQLIAAPGAGVVVGPKKVSSNPVALPLCISWHTDHDTYCVCPVMSAHSAVNVINVDTP